MKEYENWLKTNNVLKSYETYVKFIEVLSETLSIKMFDIGKNQEDELLNKLKEYDNFFDDNDVSYLKKFLVFKKFDNIKENLESIINTFKNFKSRQITEKKSMHAVKNFLLENGYSNIKNVGSQKLGWDFEAEKQLRKFFIEVKGIHSKQCKEIFFTRNELLRSSEKLDKYLIIIVTNVKSKNGKNIRVFSFDKKTNKWICDNEVLNPEPFFYKLKIENT